MEKVKLNPPDCISTDDLGCGVHAVMKINERCADCLFERQLRLSDNEDYISEYLIKGKTYVKFFLRHKEPDIQDSSFSQTDSGNEDEEDNKDSI